MLAWPIRCISSRVLAPDAAASVLPVCRRSWKWKPSEIPAVSTALVPLHRPAEVARPQHRTLLTGEHQRLRAPYRRAPSSGDSARRRPQREAPRPGRRRQTSAGRTPAGCAARPACAAPGPCRPPGRHRSAASSPQRRPEKAATRTSAEKRGGMASARARTCATVAVDRSGNVNNVRRRAFALTDPLQRVRLQHDLAGLACDPLPLMISDSMTVSHLPATRPIASTEAWPGCGRGTSRQVADERP